MNIKALASNLSYALIAQAISLVVSFAVSLLVPKTLGVEQFGLWQLFTFYSSYVGFFHFGLNDGVYLIEGGRTRSEIDKEKVKAQFILGFLMEAAIALLVVALSFLLLDDTDRVFVLCSTAAYLVLKNSADYLGYVFQATNETKFYSIYSMVDRVSFLVPLLALLILNIDDFRPYVVSYLGARTVGFVYCLIKARGYLNVGWLKMPEAIRLSILSMRAGIKLMLANLTSMLILGFGRFLVDDAWGIMTFSQLSLALSLVNFVLVFATQFAMVLFPALRQSKRDEQLKLYAVMKSVLQLLSPIVYLSYFPLFVLVCWWLPAYSETTLYLGMLLPICIFDIKMSILGTTFFKVLRREGDLLKCNVACLAVSVVLTSVSVYLLASIHAVVLGMVGCIVLRSFLAEVMLSRNTGSAISVEQVLELALTAAFVASVMLLPLTCSLFIVAAFSVAYFVACKRDLCSLFYLVKEKIHGRTA